MVHTEIIMASVFFPMSMPSVAHPKTACLLSSRAIFSYVSSKSSACLSGLHAPAGMGVCRSQRQGLFFVFDPRMRGALVPAYPSETHQSTNGRMQEMRTLHRSEQRRRENALSTAVPQKLWATHRCALPLLSMRSPATGRARKGLGFTGLPAAKCLGQSTRCTALRKTRPALWPGRQAVKDTSRR